MDTDSFRDMVQERRSVRGYRKDPVPRDVIEEIIEIAGGAPSSMNTQPWYFHVLTAVSYTHLTLPTICSV